jgi:hypothetical protein
MKLKMKNWFFSRWQLSAPILRDSLGRLPQDERTDTTTRSTQVPLVLRSNKVASRSIGGGQWKTFSIVLGLILFSAQAFAANSIISTASAPGAFFGHGYQGSLVSTGTQVMRGTIICKQGLDVTQTSSLFYDADGPIYGMIRFNGTCSTLKLASDLRLGSTCVFKQSASGALDRAYMTIDAGNSTDASKPGHTIIMGDDLRLTFSTKFISNCVIDGRGHTLTLQAPLSVFNMNMSVTLKNMRLVVYPGCGSSVATTSIPFIFNADDQTQRINLCNVDLALPPTATTQVVTAGRLNFHGKSSISGPGGIFKVHYKGDPSPKLTVGASSRLTIGQGVTFSLWGAPNVPRNNRLILTPGSGGYAATSELWLNGCTLDISDAGGGTTHGLELDCGTLFFDNKVTVSCTTAGAVETDMTQGLQLGDGTSAHNLNVRVRGGAYLVQVGTMRYNHS